MFDTDNIQSTISPLPVFIISLNIYKKHIGKLMEVTVDSACDCTASHQLANQILKYM